MHLRLPAFLSRSNRSNSTPAPGAVVAVPIPMAAAPPVPDDDVGNDDDEALDPEAAGVVDFGALPQRLRALFRDPRYQPPTPPAVALELMALSRKSEIDLAAAEALFRRDPMLTAKVLRVARSPLYGSARVPGIREAIVRLGSRRLHHVVLEAALELRVFRSAQWGHWMERVRLHSIAVAHIASHIAHRGDVDQDQAFIAGLMHDIGTAAAIGAVGDRHRDFADVDPEGLAQALDVIHTEIGGAVADAWQMNAEVKLVVAGHHDVQLKKSPLLAVIVVAEALAIDAGFGVGADLDPFVDDDLVHAKKVLDLDEHKLALIATSLQPLLATL